MLLVSAAVFGACAGDKPAAPPVGGVTVAAFGFTESRILAELYGQALEAKGIPVRRALDLASREVVEPALEQGAVDLVPEYSGTALEFLNRAAGQATADPAATYGLLRAAFSTRGVTTLDPAPAQNQNALAVSETTAQHFRLATVSDLRPYAHDMVLGGPPECPERQFCLAGLTAVYGLSFRAVRALDAGGPLTIGALEGDEIDVGIMFTTSPAIAASRLVLLADDRGLQPAENVVPVVQRGAGTPRRPTAGRGQRREPPAHDRGAGGPEPPGRPRRPGPPRGGPGLAGAARPDHGLSPSRRPGRRHPDAARPRRCGSAQAREPPQPASPTGLAAGGGTLAPARARRSRSSWSTAGQPTARVTPSRVPATTSDSQCTPR